MTKIQAWFALSRPPFHTVGILPFVLGTVLACRVYGSFRLPVFLLGTAGVILVMLATYYSGEYWDFLEDTLSQRRGRSRFAGGSGVVQKGLLSRPAALAASLVSIFLALVTGSVLQFVLHTGVWTIPLGLAGLSVGFFYSARPIRWVSTGLGEIWIAFCYGWLPVAAGCYLQSGRILPVVHWLALPIGMTIFNVILLNEMLDHEADHAAGKKNMMVRLGARRASYLYALVSALAWSFFYASVRHGAPQKALLFYLPVFGLSVVLVFLVVQGRWQDRRTLETLCGATILVNLGTTASYIFAYV